ncbi:hypothetical protein GCM10018790_34440 [Kitasatospora xanthocidica]|nr:hypothetical protein GCM10018790_34440 [Kitasatospora xanthocidica]
MKRPKLPTVGPASAIPGIAAFPSRMWKNPIATQATPIVHVSTRSVLAMTHPPVLGPAGGAQSSARPRLWLTRVY